MLIWKGNTVDSGVDRHKVAEIMIAPDCLLKASCDFISFHSFNIFTEKGMKYDIPF